MHLIAGQAAQQVQMLLVQEAQVTPPQLRDTAPPSQAPEACLTLAGACGPAAGQESLLRQPCKAAGRRGGEEERGRSAAAGQRHRRPCQHWCQAHEQDGLWRGRTGPGPSWAGALCTSRSSRERAKYSLRSAYAPAGITSGTLTCCPANFKVCMAEQSCFLHQISRHKRAASLLSTCGLCLQASNWLLIYLGSLLVRALWLQWRQSGWARGRAWALSASAGSGLGLPSATAQLDGGVLERTAPGRGPPHGAGQHPAPGQLAIGTCFVAARSASLCLSSPATGCIGPDQLASDPRLEYKTICLGSDCHTPVLLQIPVTRL